MRDIDVFKLKCFIIIIMTALLATIDAGLALSGLATLLVLAVTYSHIKAFTFWSKRGIKGPRPWPILGTNVYYIFKDRTILDIEWRKKYGHIYGTYEGLIPVLRVTDNELIKHVWIKNFSSFTDRNHKLVHSENVSRWLFFSKGEHWNNQRVLISPMFTSSRMKVMFNIMSNCVNRFTDEVNTRLKLATKSVLHNLDRQQDESDEIVQAKALAKATQLVTFSKDEFMSLTLDIIARGFFSLKLDTYRDKTSEFFKRAFAFANFDIVWFFFWMFIPNTLRRYFGWDIIKYSQYEYFEKLSQSSIDERRRDPSKRRADFIQALIEAKLPEKSGLENTTTIKSDKLYNEDDDRDAHYNDNIKHEELENLHDKQSKSIKFRSFDDKEIRSQMTFFFLAGFETTSSSLSFCFYELAHQQAAQAEVYQELLAHTNNGDKQLDYSELLSLKLLDAFISEALRLYSPVTEHNRLVTNKNGVTLPTEPPIQLPYMTTISNPGFVYQRDPDYWENPLKFDMSRFYPENRHKIKSATYNPFGIGPRNCAGMRFALLNLKLALASTLLKYRVLPGPKSQQYPPEFNRHSFFLQLKHTDFHLMPRHLEEVPENNVV